MEYLKPDVIAHVPPGDGLEWHPVIILLRRDDANRMAVGINMLLRAVAEAAALSAESGEISAMVQFSRLRDLARSLAIMAPDTRRVMAEVALALDVRLASPPNQKGTQDLKAQAKSNRYAYLYESLLSDINMNSKAFGEEPGSLYARCGHKRVAEVGGKARCDKGDCYNYVRKALTEWETENGAAQQGQGAN